MKFPWLCPLCRVSIGCCCCCCCCCSGCQRWAGRRPWKGCWWAPGSWPRCCPPWWYPAEGTPPSGFGKPPDCSGSPGGWLAVFSPAVGVVEWPAFSRRSAWTGVGVGRRPALTGDGWDFDAARRRCSARPAGSGSLVSPGCSILSDQELYSSSQLFHRSRKKSSSITILLKQLTKKSFKYWIQRYRCKDF